MNTSLLSLVDSYNSIGIMGMCKNAGKTEVLNHIINGYAKADSVLGLTSIGRDGEELDIVTSTKKPEIFVMENTLVATTRSSLALCDFTKEILSTTGINTPMGEVIIVKALSAGYVDLSGPSIVQELLKVKEQLFSFGASKIIIDGALSRKSLCSPRVIDGCILATGAALSRSMPRVISDTLHTVRLFSLRSIEDKKIIQIAEENRENNVVVIIQKDYSTKVLTVISSLHCSKEVTEALTEQSSYLLINGAVTDRLLDSLLSLRKLIKDLTLIVKDSTRLLISEEALSKFLGFGASIRVLKESKLLALTINPTSPEGYDFNPQEFKEALQEKVDIPVINVFN